MSSSAKKRRTTKKPTLKKKENEPSPVLVPSPESTPNPSLPNDLLVSFFARMSRLYYPSLSLVSKSFGTLLASPELYQTRSSLGNTESCLYVCLKFPPDPNPRWFTLCRKPTLTNDTLRKKKKSSGYVLATVSIPHSRPAHWSGLVVVGSNIYNIGESIDDTPSSCVSILDCRSQTWREAPSMRVERSYPMVNVVDGKIYVAGGCENCNSSNWMEVFDPKTQAWELVSCPFTNICERGITMSTVIEGKMYMDGDKCVSYKPKEKKWEGITGLACLAWGWTLLSDCVIDNKAYCYHNVDVIQWYDPKIRDWLPLMGLKGLPKIADYRRVKMADYDGKLVVLWDKYLPSSGYLNKTIWCAVIALERRSKEEMWGDVEWVDAVLTVPKSYKFVSALSATF